MGNGDSKAKYAVSSVGGEEKTKSESPKPVVKMCTEEGDKKMKEETKKREGDAFEVILSPARCQRGPLHPRQLAKSPESPNTRMEAVAERRRRQMEETVSKAEKLEKGPESKRTMEEDEGEAKLEILRAKEADAEAKRSAHLASVVEKAKACSSPKNSSPAPSPARSLPRIQAKLEEADERRAAILREQMAKLAAHDDHVKAVRLNAANNVRADHEDSESPSKSP